jgi:hypothetical protein
MAVVGGILVAKGIIDRGTATSIGSVVAALLIGLQLRGRLASTKTG